MKESLKKIGAFFALLLIVIGAVSSLVIVGQAHQWVAFVGELLVVAAAVPSVIKMVKFLLN